MSEAIDKLTLGDLVNFKRGYDLPHRDREKGSIPIISSSGLTGWHKKSMAKAPGVVTGRYGTLGEVFYIEKDYWPLNTSLYVQDFKTNNPKFIYYYLKTVLNENFNSAGAVPGVNRNYLHKIKVPPVPKDQKKIAVILSAYDDLIENNKRRIALLENMAEEIYREWFVRFRFPGYQTTEFEKGIPKGWEVVKIKEIASFLYGYTESSCKDDSLPKFLRVMDINKGSFVAWGKVPNCPIDEIKFNKYQLNKNDIVIARMADPGKVAIIEKKVKAVFASYLIKIEYSKEKITPYYFFYTMRSDSLAKNFSNANSGSTRGSINAQAIGNMFILLPPLSLMENFEKIIMPLRSQVSHLDIQNEKLEKIKNMLLPRLISGKLSVENLDIRFPPSMQTTVEAE